MDELEAPATKRDLNEVELRLKQDLNEVELRLKQEILEGVQEMVRDAQAEILKAFFPFQESVAVRFRVQDGAVQGIKERMDVLERRLMEIEKRLLMNPPAA